MQRIFTEPDPVPTPDPSVEGFSVCDVLDQRAFAMRKRRKRTRTRAALLAAAARELERVGYDALTVEGISEAAGVTRGTFYLYYKSRSAIMSVILRFYWVLLAKYRPRGGADLPLSQTIERSNTYLVQVIARNTQLLLAREILMTESPGLARRLDQVNDQWAGQVVRALVLRGLITDLAADPVYHHLRARTVIGMSDVLLRDIYRSAGLNGARQVVDTDLIIRVLNDLWRRFMAA
ncbi:TetR/AcrR family transcriptional regulator [uncultured Paracoccus sp.]|uniref:TetR/AcrR family transcriptional regulator n=1 Tax=uncultured Paracoccus sp. TaxID=189685 RepID=UPI00262052E9|nr:TetR/AcrR family transcriptional regulator [uncultured Paracoccus sp.]